MQTVINKIKKRIIKLNELLEKDDNLKSYIEGQRDNASWVLRLLEQRLKGE